jgi:hypothetical protein
MEIPGQFIPGAGTSAATTDRTLFPESAGEPVPDQIGQAQQPFLTLLASLVMEQGTGVPATLPEQQIVAAETGPCPIPVETNVPVDSRNNAPVMNAPVAQSARMVPQMAPHQEGLVPVSDPLIPSFVRQAGAAVAPVSDPDLIITSNHPGRIIARPFVMESVPGQSSKSFPHQVPPERGIPEQPAKTGAPILPKIEAEILSKGKAIPEGKTIVPSEIQTSEPAISMGSIPSTAGNEMADISRSAPIVPQSSSPANRVPGRIQAIPVLRNPIAAHWTTSGFQTEIPQTTEPAKAIPTFVTASGSETVTGARELPAISSRPVLPASESGIDTTSAVPVSEPGEVLLRVLDPLPVKENVRTAGRQPAVNPPIAAIPDIKQREPVVRTAPTAAAEKKADVPRVSETTLDVPVKGRSEVREHAVDRLVPNQQSTDLVSPAQRRVVPVSDHVNTQKVQTEAMPGLSRPVVDSPVAVGPAVTELVSPEIGPKNVRPSKEPRHVEEKRIEKQDLPEGSVRQKAGPAGPVRKEQATSTGDEQRKESTRPIASGDQPEKVMNESPLQVAKPEPGRPVARESEITPARKNSTATGPAVEKALPHAGGLQTQIRTAALHRATRESSSGEVPARPATQILDQLVRSIRMDVGERTSEMRIVLDPATLGEVLVNVSVENGSISAKFDVVNPETRAIIETNLPQLQQALAARGLIVERIDVASAQSFMQRNPHESGQTRGKQGTRRHNDGVEEAGDRSSRFLGYNTLELTL